MNAKHSEAKYLLVPPYRIQSGPFLKTAIFFPEEEGKTKQSFKDECDINVILKRYESSGTLEHVNQRQALYADCTAANFQSFMDTISNARTAFEDLPARVRDYFDNEPANMLAFIEDPDNLDEAQALGLLSAERSEALAAEKAAKAENEAVGGAKPAAANRAGDKPAPTPKT